MTYKETIDYLFTSAPLFQQKGAGAYKPGLQTTEALDAYFGHPHREFPVVHVAGTNGKGSTCHSLAAIFQDAGLKTALYTSPHLVDFRERIRINGVPVPEEYVVRFVEDHRHFFEPLHPSFFELTTAMAFRYFADEHVDVAVIETGLGGRLDCTNIVTPILSIVTNISLDHTSLLGHTLEAIAREKAGIFKPGIPALIGEATEETRRVFLTQAKEVGCPITFAEDESEILALESQDIGRANYQTRTFGRITCDLTGLCQDRNMNTILHTVQLLRSSSIGKTFSDDNVRNGLQHVCDSTGLLGRWQRLSSNPDIICDTGHNVGGWTYLSRALSAIAGRPSGRLFFLLGFASDKDVESIFPMLPHRATYLWVQASVERAMAANTLAERAKAAGILGNAYTSFQDALSYVRSIAQPSDTIFVGGSTFVVADLLRLRENA